MNAYDALKRFIDNNKVFNLIFIDPPYLKDMIPKAIDMITEGNLLDPNGLIVTKIDSTEDIYKGNHKIELINERIYGNTTVCFYKYKED